MKILISILIIHIFLSVKAQEKPEAIGIQDVNSPILGIEKSPSGKYLFMTLNGGRFLLFDTSKEKLNENSHPLWKNFTVAGFNLGGDAEFSLDEKYILVSEQKAMYAHDRVKIESVKIAVVDAETGNIVFEASKINNAQFLNDNESILMADEGGIFTYNYKTKTQGKAYKIDNCEIVCLNNAENMLAVSYDPAGKDFKEENGAGLNKKEVKNAVKNKKLISFYEYPSMKPYGIINEEIDVVSRMQYSSDDKYLLFFSRTRQPEHEHINILNGMDRANDLNQFQRIDMNTLKVDNLNFIHQTSEQLANFDVNLKADLFAFSDNKGFLAGKREVVVTTFRQQNSQIGIYTFQGRAKTRNLFSTAFAIENESTVLVANGLKISYWDFVQHPNYTEYIEPVNKNDLLDKAIGQLDDDLLNPESSLSRSLTKKQIQGLYLFNITIQKGGEVVSVFAQSDEKTNIQMQNSLKDTILKYKFDVSVPKNERIKFAYTFTL